MRLCLAEDEPKTVFGASAFHVTGNRRASQTGHVCSMRGVLQYAVRSQSQKQRKVQRMLVRRCLKDGIQSCIDIVDVQQVRIRESDDVETETSCIIGARAS